ncbi:uncharacterized protein LOC110772366 isoform X2 [Prunus avium]|uniref:Uncharacterized protein LOC110772366 isoform X2 n=1 Tax=Prunus avium TaxID=42229 RepID=A0A6P5TZU3_PRUAV|nr:uncharacterized protein LOC110772366 isoform X2 [Prunus avium]
MFIVASLFLSSNLLRLLGKEPPDLSRVGILFYMFCIIKLIVSGTLVIKCSKGIKTQRFIGPCTSLEKGPVVADIATGEGNRTTWKMCKKAELTHTPKNKLMKFISN